MRIIIVSALCLLLTSCATYKLVGAEPVTVNGMHLQPHAKWNKAPNAPGKNVEVWTADGHQLNELILIGEVEGGKPLFKTNNKELPMPQFRPGMLPNEVQDLMTTSLENLFGGDITINTSNLRPVNVQEQMGLRFNIDFYTQDGLAKRGDVLVVEKNQQLYSMILVGTKIYYYDSLASEFDMMTKSLTI